MWLAGEEGQQGSQLSQSTDGAPHRPTKENPARTRELAAAPRGRAPLPARAAFVLRLPDARFRRRRVAPLPAAVRGGRSTRQAIAADYLLPHNPVRRIW